MSNTIYKNIASEEGLEALVRELRIKDLIPVSIGLVGELGAGKTTLVKFIAKSLDIDPSEVSSPSYNLLNGYQSSKFLIEHWDLYRLDYLPEELNYTPESNVLRIIEWSNLVENPSAILDYEIKIEMQNDQLREYSLISLKS